MCSSGAVAREVAFDKNVLANCVTVEGDMLSPGGLLTGGSRGGQASVLKKLHAMYEAEAEKADAEGALAERRAEWARAKKALDALADLEADADAAEHALGLVRAKLEGSEAHQLAEKVAELMKSVASETEAAEKAELAKKEASELASKLEEEIRDWRARFEVAERREKDARADAAALAEKARVEALAETAGTRKALDVLRYRAAHSSPTPPPSCTSRSTRAKKAAGVKSGCTYGGTAPASSILSSAARTVAGSPMSTVYTCGSPSASSSGTCDVYAWCDGLP